MSIEEAPRPYYTIGLSYVGGRSFLEKALDSIGEKHWHRTHVWNNSEPLERLQATAEQWQTWQEITPRHPMTHTQAVNCILQDGAGLDAAFIAHCDMECEPDTIDRMLEMLPTLPKKFAVLFSNYDALAMYNPKAFTAIGPWDWQLFPSYFSDPDWYRRVKLAGWSIHESNLPVKHVGSHVINKVDKWRKHYTGIQFEQWRDNYIKKWGGDPGNETYATPFDFDERGPYPDA